MFKLALVVPFVMVISGCATHTQLAEVHQKVHQFEWTELTCSGFLTWNACKQAAQAKCPQGFYMADPLENWLIQRRVVSVACKV